MEECYFYIVFDGECLDGEIMCFNVNFSMVKIVLYVMFFYRVR